MSGSDQCLAFSMLLLIARAATGTTMSLCAFATPWMRSGCHQSSPMMSWSALGSRCRSGRCPLRSTPQSEQARSTLTGEGEERTKEEGRGKSNGGKRCEGLNGEERCRDAGRWACGLQISGWLASTLCPPSRLLNFLLLTHASPPMPPLAGTIPTRPGRSGCQWGSWCLASRGGRLLRGPRQPQQ
jgi:hypothetical protein